MDPDISICYDDGFQDVRVGDGVTFEELIEEGYDESHAAEIVSYQLD